MNIRKKLKSIITLMLSSFNPTKYHTLMDVKKRRAITYFLQMTALVFVVTIILMIPNLFAVPEIVSDEFSKFNRLQIDLDYEQTAPINLPQNNPILTIDTTPTREKEFSGFMLITDQSFYYRLTPFTKGTRIALEDEASAGISNVIVSLLILSLPTMIVLTYIYSVIKYLIIIGVLALIGFVLARVIRFGITIQQTFKVALFAATPMVVLALLTKPFIPSLGYLEYVVYIIFFVLGCIKIGEFEEVVKSSEKRREHR